MQRFLDCTCDHADFLTVPPLPRVDIGIKSLNFFEPNSSGDDQVRDAPWHRVRLAHINFAHSPAQRNAVWHEPTAILANASLS